MKDYASWRIHHPDCFSYCAQKNVSELRGDTHSFFIKVTISQTNHYAGGFCGTDASWSYTLKDD